MHVKLYLNRKIHPQEHQVTRLETQRQTLLVKVVCLAPEIRQEAQKTIC